ncbi:hypothetical protein [Priestia aryabhattai]|uniref:hypothetical protein n=1 Tax=Priestia aryabhattai TaxID=412384 RepID=UPI00398374A4
MIEGQGKVEQMRPCRSGRPRKAKPCTEIRRNKGCILAHYPICSSLDWGDFVMSQSLLLSEFPKMDERRYFFCFL